MTSVLPKKRSGDQKKRKSSAVLHDLSNKGRVISGRSVSNTKRKPSGTRHVSRGDMFVGRDEEDANSSFADDAIHFHENRSTIMSNFEEWIKLSTDNKITTKNSWQFALIDYFHDMNVIKDGDNINFQRASATLDGCVKIYLSRVESAASETGKLLSGLATKKGQIELEDAQEEGEEDGEAEDSANSKKERRVNRIVESTLVSFDALKIKKLDQELAIDPLFKKALADFDEGGAKSLLLNTLNIDSSGRVVFDATTNSMNPDEESESESKQDDMDVDKKSIDFLKLRNMFVSSGPELETLSICPSILELKLALSDVNKAKTVLGDVNDRFNADEEEERNLADSVPPEENLPDYDYDMDFEAQDEKREDVNLDNIENEIQKAQDVLKSYDDTQFDEGVTTATVMDQDLMAYFDEKMRTNWRGPEHWKVTTLKQSKNLDGLSKKGQTPQPETAPKRIRKEDITINFFEEEEEDFLENIFQKHKNPFQISKRPEECKIDDFHVLPDDIQFNSQRLVNLFLKPKKSIVTFSKRSKNHSNESNLNDKAYTDENYFAGKYLEQEKALEEEARQEKLAASFLQAEMEDYDNDNFGGIDFNDVLGGEDGTVEGEEETKNDNGSQFVTGGRKARPEYVNFSKVAKRVDVKLLKDNLWKSIKKEENEKEKSVSPEEQLEEDRKKTFTEVVETISEMYRPEEKKDLSTSFCFICLLHLANEHGLSIAATDAHDDLLIKGF